MRKISIKELTIYIFLWISLFPYPHPLSASETDTGKESELNWVLKNVKQTELKLNTFTAKMVQIRKTQLLKSPLQSEGFIYFDHRGNMLFKVTSPSPLMVLFKDDTVRIYYPDLPKMEERYIGRNILREFFGIGSSIEKLREQYAIQLISKTAKDSYHLKLVPKREMMGKYFDWIKVTVNPNQWLPEQIHFREKDGDWSSISLEFTSVNEPLPPNVFNIHLPEDYEDDQ